MSNVKPQLPTIQPTAEQKLQIDRVRATIRQHSPAWFILCSELNFAFSTVIDTACTDGSFVWFCPKFWESLSHEERVFVWLHELFHCADKHHLRRGERNHELFNIAGDYVINLRLASIEPAPGKKAWLKMPSCGLIDQKYTGLNIFDVYAELEKQQKQKPQKPGQGQGQGQPGQGQGQPGQGQGQPGQGQGQPGQGQGQGATPAKFPGNIGGVIDGSFESEAQKKQHEDKLTAVVQRAAITEKLCGKGSSGTLEELALNGRKASKSLQAFLSQFMDNTYASAAQWERGNKRLASAGIYYPSLRKDSLAAIAFAVDTSGSVSKSELERISAIVANVFATSQFSKLHIVYFHSDVYRVDTFNHGDKFELSPIECGGTDFEPVFDTVEKLKAKALVMLTDGCAPTPNKPKFPVAWCLTTESDYYAKPYGRKIAI